jgi:TRAP-type C4-dicarboxylate transport system permease small subunit
MARPSPAFRIGVAAVGLLFSMSWMLERAALTSSDPFDGVQTWLVEQPLVVAGVVAALAVVARRATPPAAAPTSAAVSRHGPTRHDLG